ncbi:MAG: ABC transporter ATP-binding protein [Bacteroidota bacterium]|jgi:ABC-2 type transport system ATP-binding protein|nr:ABC transporter ATP-binding protein [Bacteroidota bacterium]HHU01099.1 ABC transporter ATP-binding protein [Bacteroidales bacterium]
MTTLVARNIRKSYGRVRALNGVSFETEKGEMFGIIGPDGAGKTTLFRILTSLMLPDEGDVKVGGFDTAGQYQQVRNLIGYMPGRFSLYQDLSVEENLAFFATVYNTTIEENYHLIEDIYRQIEPFKDRRAGKLSGGMKQKLALCCSLIHKPEVLFLDEPTTGIDPVSRRELWEMLRKLKAQGITIIVSTPYMDEAVICDRIALIKNGEFLTVDSPANITKAFPDKLWSVQTDHRHRLMHDLHNCSFVRSSFLFGDSFHVSFTPDGSPERLENYLHVSGHTKIGIDCIEPGVEDCFLAMLKDNDQAELMQTIEG